MTVNKGTDGDYDPNGGTLTFDANGTWTSTGDDGYGAVVVSGATNVDLNGGDTITVDSVNIDNVGGELDLNGGTLDLEGVGVDTPIMDAFSEIGGAIMGKNCWE